MDVDQLLNRLGYAESPCFLRAGTEAFTQAPDHGHVFRHAQADMPRRLHGQCEVLGVYSLSAEAVTGLCTQVPLVYVCSADSQDVAQEVHRLVWNQDVVPFILVHTPRGLILHSGFWYERRQGHATPRGILKNLTAFNAVDDLIRDFHASAIDSGFIWQSWRSEVRPEKRIDWRLLGNLKKLSSRLQGNGVDRGVAHALIGKYVFLHYLRDRGILSPRKLDKWGLAPGAVFGRTATLEGLRTCVEQLESWLNGGVFPINWRGRRAPSLQDVRAVASTFSGDEPQGTDWWQLAFDFGAYEFSYIPIETLSVIYEQFLHAPRDDGASQGKEQGAYYTPIPLVNLMLAQLEEHKSIASGVKVLDPACGSGAFLVQAYRRLIEREFPPISDKRPTPAQLRELLTSHIFGVDLDADACSVTELSLQLTLLDYVEPPDLEETTGQKKFQLPALRGKNIVHADFFDQESADLNKLRRRQFDVVVGNPRWKNLTPQKLNKEDKHVWSWIQRHGGPSSDTPVGGYQVAHAFTWKIKEVIGDDAQVAFLIPGISLFEARSRRFREVLFRTYDVHTVVNLANLTEVLFAGRSRVPAAALFFQPGVPEQQASERWVRTVAPLVANQEANRPQSEGTRAESWSLVINESEQREIAHSQISNGEGLPWKLALWGSFRDARLIGRMKPRFERLADLEATGRLLVSEGLQLRTVSSSEPLDEVPEVVGKVELNVNVLKRYRRFFSFPSDALSSVPVERRFVRKGRGTLPLSVCRPPHVVVSAARIFAVYSDEFLIVPPRQIGIVSPSDDRNFLKALSLYLSSDFAFYHQFLTTTEFGVKRDRATLQSLRRIPVPVTQLSRDELAEWAGLHAKLARTLPRTLDEVADRSRRLFQADKESGPLLAELNERVFGALKLHERERALVNDLVNVRLALNDGHIGAAAVRPPNEDVIARYGRRLRKELDGFIGDILPKRHNVAVVYDELSGMVEVELVAEKRRAAKVAVSRADRHEVRQLARTRDRLSRQYAQWVYFNRNLRIYDGNRTYVFKPMQTFHWTESQALSDAAEIIAETMDVGESA